jgi:signal recognition particle subunit SRP54
MGDILTLIEKAQNEVDAEQARKMSEKIKKADFDFNDFLDQMKQLKKLGGLSGVMSMMPAMGANLKDLPEPDEKQTARVEAIILSMTKEERTNPAILTPSRKNRIAAGAGVEVAEVNRIVKQFDQMKKLMKQLPGMMGGKKRGFGLPGGLGGMLGKMKF